MVSFSKYICSFLPEILLLVSSCNVLYVLVCTHFVITPFSEVEICREVFNVSEFHFSEVYFFQTWYFRGCYYLLSYYCPYNHNSFVKPLQIFCNYLCMYIKQKSVTFVNRAVLLKTVVLQPQPFFKIVRDLGILVGIRKMLCSCDCSLRSRRAHTGACTTDRSKFSKKMCLNLKEYFQFCPILKIMNFQSSFHLIFKS